MQRTVPQIIMLNFEAWRSQKNAELKSKAKYAKKEEAPSNEDTDDPIIAKFGMRFSELQKHPTLLDTYYRDWS